MDTTPQPRVFQLCSHKRHSTRRAKTRTHAVLLHQSLPSFTPLCTMSTKNGTTKQTSLELTETSHGVKKSTDGNVSSTDGTLNVMVWGEGDFVDDEVTMNRRTSSSVVSTSKDSTAETNVHAPASNKVERKRSWRKSVSFPNSKKYNSCCGTCVRFGGHSLVDTDDLILRQEREQLAVHMQQEEEILSLCDQRVEYVVECSMGFCCKKPKSCFSYGETCLKHTATVWVYRVWQVAIIVSLLFLFENVSPYKKFENVFCKKSPIMNFHCDAVQEQLRRSNYTKDSNGYAGMINTMKALEESDLVSYGDKVSVLLNTSNIDPETEYPENYEDFLGWHARTRSSIPGILRILNLLFFNIVVPGSLFLVFGKQFQKDDPTEIMFPPLLEEAEGAKEMQPDMELGNKEFDYTQRFHFIRPKKFVLRSSLWIMLMLFLVLWGGVNGLTLNPLGLCKDISVAICLGPVGSIIFIGLFVQIHNATTLANILVQLCSIRHLSSEQRQAQFDQWKDYYKSAVGALHVWSWRVTPVIGTALLAIVSFIIWRLVSVIFYYTTINSEPDLADSQRMGMFLKLGSKDIQATVIFTLVLLIGTGAIAVVSNRYKRLNLLVATLRLPKHELQDFEIIQNQNAAVTIFDVPITANTVATILRLLFVQTALVALTTAGS